MRQIRARFTPQRVLALGVMTVVLVVCGMFSLADHPPRDWSLHWVAPRTIVASSTQLAPASVGTARGWDTLWQRPSGSMVLSHFDRAGNRIGPDTPVLGAPVSMTLGRTGNTDVAFWREDFAAGSKLRAAVVSPGRAINYLTLALGSQSLEHPYAFTSGHDVDVVFSWQVTQFNVYLAQVHADGTATAPRRLTNVASYAFDPHAAVDSQGAIVLLYMNECCGSAAFNMTEALYSPTGRPLGRPHPLGVIQSVGSQGSGSTPDRWALDVQRVGSQVWAVWGADTGLELARWQAGSLVGAPQIIIPGAASPVVALASAGGRQELSWQQPTSLSQVLEAVPLDRNGLPTAEPDRLAYEAATDDSPFGISVGNLPGYVWQSIPSKSSTITVESTHYSVPQIGAPSVWARLGLGLGNPFANILILLVAGFALGVLIAVANLLLVFALVVMYFGVFRIIQGAWKWYVYPVAVAVVLFVLFVHFGAPTPPVFFMSGISGTLGTLSLIGMVIFTGVLLRVFLTRVDDIFRAGIVAFSSLFFLGFLEALSVVQGQVGRI